MEHNRLHSPGFLRFGVHLAKFLGWILLTLFGRFHTKGKYRVPKTGGLLILSNHLSDIDPVAVQVACPRPIYFMAKSELFEMKGLRNILHWFCAFPVKRGEPDRSALRHAIELLKSGNVVCIFPEGQLSVDGELQELKAGVGLIIKKAQVQCICLGLKNTNAIIPYGSLLPRPTLSKVSAEWGEPIQFGSESEIEEMMQVIHQQLKVLVAS